MKAINQLITTDEAEKLINKQHTLILAAEESILDNLPKGNWIGGTIPYFMDVNGGCFSKNKVFVTDFTEVLKNFKIEMFDKTNIKNVVKNRYENGFSLMLIPCFSEILNSFAMQAQSIEELYNAPLLGWVTGIDLNNVGKQTPQVFDGRNGNKFDNNAIVMHIEIPANKMAELDIINIFSQGDGDSIEFLEDGFSCKECLVNGKKINLADYIKSKNIDIRLPLVADYSGALINISFQQINEEDKSVLFYAPLRKNTVYKLAKPVENYVKVFNENIPKNANDLIFSCNCILNYLYSELEGKTTGGITGPITFGEIAYVLVNQTLVHLNILDI